MRFPFGAAFPSLGKARVCKSSKAGKSFSVRRWSDKSSSISPCRHPLLPHRLSSPSSFFSLLSSCPLDSLLHHLSHPLALSLADGRRRLKLTRVVRPSVFAYSVCSSTLLHRHTCALPSRTHTHVRSSSRRECAPVPASPRLASSLSFAYVGEGRGTEGARALSFSRRIQCVRVKNTRYWSRVDARKRQEIRETGLSPPSLPSANSFPPPCVLHARERECDVIPRDFRSFIVDSRGWIREMERVYRCLIILLLLERERYVCTQA